MGLSWRFKEVAVAGHRAHSGALQVEASQAVGALLQYLTCPLSKQMLWAWHRARSWVHAPNTLVFLITPLLRWLLLIRKARAFLLYSSHLEELIRQLPAAWGASPSPANYFPDCFRLHSSGPGMCGSETFSHLVICSAEEVLLFSVVWTFSIWATYQHQLLLVSN